MSSDAASEAAPKDTVRVLGIAFTFFALAAFFTSLPLPALFYQAEPDAESPSRFPGFGLLLLGWIETLRLSTNGIAWLASPFFAFGILFLLVTRFGWALILFLVSGAFATVSFRVESICIDEAGNYAAVVGLGPGFWLWYYTILASCAVSLGFLFVRLSSRSSSASRT